MNDYVATCTDLFNNNIVMEHIKEPNKSTTALAHSKLTGYDYSPEQSLKDLQDDQTNRNITIEVMKL